MNKYDFKNFIAMYSDLGGNISDTAIMMIKEDVKEYALSFDELKKALQVTHSREQFMNWANVMKYARYEDRVLDGGKW